MVFGLPWVEDGNGTSQWICGFLLYKQGNPKDNRTADKWSGSFFKGEGLSIYIFKGLKVAMNKSKIKTIRVENSHRATIFIKSMMMMVIKAIDGQNDKTQNQILTFSTRGKGDLKRSIIYNVLIKENQFVLVFIGTFRNLWFKQEVHETTDLLVKKLNG